MNNSGNLALRRVRLLTALALICVPWILVSYDISWDTTLTTLAVGVALGCAVMGVRFLLLRKSPSRRGKT